MSWVGQLYQAVEGRETDAIDRLLRERPVGGDSAVAGALRIAIHKGFVDVVKAFLRVGVNPNARAVDDTTPLMWAANGRCLEILQLLLDSGADVNCADRNGWTPVFYAAASQDLAAVQTLCDAGADIFRRDIEGRTPADVSSYRRFTCRLPILRWGGGIYRTLRDTPVRAFLKARLTSSRLG